MSTIETREMTSLVPSQASSKTYENEDPPAIVLRPYVRPSVHIDVIDGPVLCGSVGGGGPTGPGGPSGPCPPWGC